MTRESPRPCLVIASTFYVGPLELTIRFLLERLRAPLDVVLLPYGDVIPNLLDPNGELSANKGGINILLLRPEDFPTHEPNPDQNSIPERILEISTGWAKAIRFCVTASSSPLIVSLAPPSSHGAVAFRGTSEAVYEQLRSELAGLAGIHWLRHSDVTDLYEVNAVDDLQTDILGHLTYTPDYWTALATTLIRKSARIMSPPHKAVIVDCDNTLWQGICGEQAPSELLLTDVHLQFQKLLVDMSQRGVLLCLCSKNNPRDVDSVFATRGEMPLRREHIITSRINWDEKSTNIKSIARELNLGLGALIFIDDSPAECAEVRAACPEVLTLQVPREPRQFADFLRHTWEFDPISATEDAKKRHSRYEEERLRTEEAGRATSLIAFIRNLQVCVRISPMEAIHVDRVAELIARTTQFNLTTARHSANVISRILSNEGQHAFVIHVADRFGEYGLTGAAFLESRCGAATVETFVLSCRVMGRGVELAVLNYLGRWAMDRGQQHIELLYRPTERNQPALTFLRRAVGSFERKIGNSFSYEVPAAFASSLELEQYLGGDPVQDVPVEAKRSAPAQTPSCWRFLDGTSAPGDLKALAAEIETYRRAILSVKRRASATPATITDPALQPRSPEERALAEIWRDLLALEVVNRNDSFAELGGDSLLVMRLINRVAEQFGVRLTISSVLQCRALSNMAELVAALGNRPALPEDVELERGTL
jgi:FkbH-like protein